MSHNQDTLISLLIKDAISSPRDYRASDNDCDQNQIIRNNIDTFRRQVGGDYYVNRPGEVR